MALDERTKASFDAASEAVKQVLTLATGSIGATIALFDDGNTAGIAFGDQGTWVHVGLGLLALSVVSGLFSLGALAGQLGSDGVTKPSTYAPAVRFLHVVQMFMFGLGLLVLVFATLG